MSHDLQAADPTLAEIIGSCIRVMLSNPREDLKSAAAELNRLARENKGDEVEVQFQSTLNRTLADLFLFGGKSVEVAGNHDVTANSSATSMIFGAVETLETVLLVARRDDLLAAEAQFKDVPNVDGVEATDVAKNAGQRYVNALFYTMGHLCRAALTRLDTLENGVSPTVVMEETAP